MFLSFIHTAPGAEISRKLGFILPPKNMQDLSDQEYQTNTEQAKG